MKRRVSLLYLLTIAAILPIAVVAGELRENTYYQIGRYTSVSFGIYGPVVHGEALWLIAKSSYSEDDVNIDQAMIGLFRLNPEAFEHENINCLKEGVRLMTPNLEVLLNKSKYEAGQVVQNHHLKWVEMQKRCGK